MIRKEQWPPEEISGWLRKEESLKVSKSTIYNWIANSSPHHKDNIRRHLRRGGRKAKSSDMAGRSLIPNRLSIDARPIQSDGRTVGDWEMDTIVGKDGKGTIVTLVDRKSCYMLMEKLDTGKQAVPLAHIVEAAESVRTACKDDYHRQRK